MPRKKKHEEKKTPKKKEEEREYNPFSSIVLKEKKEPEKKKAPVVSKPKKPGEIVQGYVPSASFADILDSFEKRLGIYQTSGTVCINNWRMETRKDHLYCESNG